MICETKIIWQEDIFVVTAIASSTAMKKDAVGVGLEIHILRQLVIIEMLPKLAVIEKSYVRKTIIKIIKTIIPATINNQVGMAFSISI